MAFPPILLPDGSPNPDACITSLYLISSVWWDNDTKDGQVYSVLGGANRLAYHPVFDTWPPGWGMWQVGDTIVIGIIGTSSAQQWLGHFASLIADIKDPDLHARCQPVWLNAANTILAQILLALPLNPGNFKYVVTGHSYGSAVAQIVACKLALMFGASNVSILAFASPRSFGFTDPVAMPATWVRIHREGDLVSDVPLPFQGAYKLLVGLPLLLAGHATWSHKGQSWTISDSLQVTPQSVFEFVPWSVPGNIERTARIHFMQEYNLIFASWWQAVSPTNTFQPVFTALNSFSGISPPVTDVPSLAPLTVNTPQQLDAFYHNSFMSGIDTTNVQNIEINSLRVNLVISNNQRNMSISGGNMSSVYKVSLIFSDGENGFSENYTFNNQADLATAIQSGRNFLKKRKELLGQCVNSSVCTQTIGIGSPGCTYIRANDLLNPKNARLYKCVGNEGLPTFKGSNGTVAANLCAENAWTAAIIRSKGILAGNPGGLAFRSITLSGLPDAVLGLYTANFSFGDGSYGTSLNQMIAYMANQNNAMGIWALNPAEPKNKIVGSTAPTSPAVNWQINLLAAPAYIPGDRVKIERSGNKAFANTLYTVQSVAGNVVTLIGGPPAATAPISKGQMLRMFMANGQPTKAFFPFSQDKDDFQFVGVSERRRGRPFLALERYGARKHH